MCRRLGLLLAAAATATFTACYTQRLAPRAIPHATHVTAHASPHGSESPSRPEPPAPARNALIAQPLLFAASRGGHTSYLLGTLHLGVDAARQLPPWVWHYFNTTPTFAMEADPDDATLQHAMVRHDGSTLRDELGNVTWRRLEIAVGETTAQALLDLPVPFAMMAMALTGLPSTQPMDVTFAEAARVQHKPIFFLEAMAVQLRISSKWLDATALSFMLDDFDLVPLRNRELLNAYLRGKLIGLTQVVSDGRSDFLRTGRPGNQYDAMMTELLNQRNHMWVPVVEKLHAQHPSFIAVGALHLAGPEGLVALLRQRGFVVTQLKQP